MAMYVTDVITEIIILVVLQNVSRPDISDLPTQGLNGWTGKDLYLVTV